MRPVVKGLVGLVVAASVAAGINYSCCSSPEDIKNRPAIVLSLKQREKEMRQASGKYLEIFLGEYIDSMGPISSEIKANVDFYDLEKRKGKRNLGGKESVVRGYYDLYMACADLALSRMGKSVSEQDLNELSDRLVNIHYEMAKKTDLNVKSSPVKEGYVVWGKDKVNRFKAIFEKNIKTDSKSFEEMVRNTYGSEQFIAELERQNEAEKVLFEGFKKSIPIALRLIGAGIVDNTQKESWKRNMAEFKRFFPEKVSH